MNSLNHYAYGTISRWFYEGILGVKPKSAGFKKAVISPQLTSKLSFAEGSIRTPNGIIDVSWTKSTEGFEGRLDCNSYAIDGSTAVGKLGADLCSK